MSWEYQVALIWESILPQILSDPRIRREEKVECLVRSKRLAEIWKKPNAKIIEDVVERMLEKYPEFKNSIYV